MMIPIVATVVVVSFSGCDSTGPPPDLIDEDTYIELLAEIHLLAAIRNRYGEEIYAQTQEDILQHYDITRDQFERSNNYYHQDMDAQLERLREARYFMDKLIQEYYYSPTITDRNSTPPENQSDTTD